MRKLYFYGPGSILLAILVTLIVWQMSFNLGDYGPTNAAQTFAYWSASTLIFVLTVTLGFMLMREFVKLYLEKHRNREGSRIKTKLVVGALALSLVPVAFLAAFGYQILNRNLDKWFSRPAEGMRVELIDTAVSYGDEVQGRAGAMANWLVTIPEVRDLTANYIMICQENRIAELMLERPGMIRTLCKDRGQGDLFTARANLNGKDTLVVRLRPRANLIEKQKLIQGYISQYDELSSGKRSVRTLYLMFLSLITLFVLFVATWIALILSRQISAPIAALLEAAGQVRKGNLGYRITAAANDEMASLVRAFNEMTTALDANSRELETRRRFTEAILESIPTGVISVSKDGQIQRVNRAMRALLTEERVDKASTLADLFPPEETAEIRYLMGRARRTGVSSSHFDLGLSGQVLHLAVTVSALPANEPDAPAFVVVIEDTSELLRAQKAAAWHEVARRIAHELKNPLTPIALSAERIARLLDRGSGGADSQRILRECSTTITREVESVKNLADEFSRFSRFPAAQLSNCDLNEIVRNGMGVFSGRLEGIDVRLDLEPSLALVNADPEQLKRVVVNLVDNAAEAMQGSPTKQLLVATRAVSPDSIELLVADTGQGISAQDKEKLFLPYFSTKDRGTGLGLAIVSHILGEHGGRIRVEDNRPSGARFYVELPVAVASEAEVNV
jgi:PAS domain S-box-containing protein